MLPVIMGRLKQIRPTEMLRSEFNGIVRDAMVTIAKIWKEEMLPEHFKKGAGRKYKYAKRSRKYVYLKRIVPRMRKHPREANIWVQPGRPRGSPLVWTGDMRKAMLESNPMPQARATSNKISVKMRFELPHPIRPAQRGPKADGSWSEATRVTPLEVLELGRMLELLVAQQIDQLRQTKETTFGS